jgi:ribosome-associated protein
MNILSLPFEKEIYYRASRSSGSGGQNVNKVSTKVELNFDVAGSKLLTEEQKQIMMLKLSRNINQHGILKVTAETSRSQLENKRIALEKFKKILSDCFKEKKKRLASRPSKSSKEKRIESKKKRSELKRNRSSKWF